MSTIEQDYDIALVLDEIQRKHLESYLLALENAYNNVIKRYEQQLSLLKQQKRYLNATPDQQRWMVTRRTTVLGKYPSLASSRTTLSS